MLNLWFKILLIILLPSFVYAQENIPAFDDNSVPVLNDQLRLLNNNTNAAANNISTLKSYFIDSLLGSIYGGTSSDLSACAQGSIPYFSSTGVMSCLSPSTSGYILSTQGASANPIFIPPTPQGLTLISVTSISTAATTGAIAITNGNNYFVQYYLYNFSTNGQIPGIQFNGDSGSHYKYANIGSSTGGAIASLSASASQISLVEAAVGVAGSVTQGVTGSFYIDQLASTQIYKVWGQSTYDENTSNRFAAVTTNGQWSNATNISSISLVTSGTMTGTIYLYQLRTTP